MFRYLCAGVVLIASWSIGRSLSAPERPGTPGRDGNVPFAEQAIYLACGEVNGPGQVYQFDPTGKLLGQVTLDETPYGIAAGNNGIVVAVPKKGALLRIDAKKQVKLIYANPKTMPQPIAVSWDPNSGDILAADNQSSMLTLLPEGQPHLAKTYSIAKPGQERHNLSVAKARDGYYVFGASGPEGIYRFQLTNPLRRGNPILPKDGHVAADPASGKWAATQEHSLHVFEGAKALAEIPFPKAHVPSFGGLAYSTDGVLVVALEHGHQRFQFFRADAQEKSLRPMFLFADARVNSIAVGPRLDWPRRNE